MALWLGPTPEDLKDVQNQRTSTLLLLANPIVFADVFEAFEDAGNEMPDIGRDAYATQLWVAVLEELDRRIPTRKAV